MLNTARFPVPYVLITLENAEEDAVPLRGGEKKIARPGNNGRKILATEVVHEYGEELITNPIWKAPQVFPTGAGGIEIATFTEFSGQDRHMHEKGIEMYTVLRGEVQIYINDVLLPTLVSGDEIVILPGTVHQIVRPKDLIPAEADDFQLLVRVHSISCHGAEDKYVQLDPHGPWLRWSDLSMAERDAAYSLR